MTLKSYNGKVADSLKPTLENVTREFITETLYKILFSEELPNFKFDFREDKAITLIEEVLKNYLIQHDFYKEKAEKIIQAIKGKNDGNELVPTVIVNDYKEFFELLRQFYERDIELYFFRTGMSSFSRYEKDNCFEQIWLRATPDDFNNPEEFLKKQVDMINDETFSKYDKETCLGKLSFLEDNVLCVKNAIARTWDENSRQFEIMIYDKNYYNNKELFYRPHYTLPVIRYGIYKRNGKKVCLIGSIQNKSDSYEPDKLGKKIDRAKYKVNFGVLEEDTYQVEPKNLIALSIFIDLLNREGITEIEVPSLYVLDYEYHEKRNKLIQTAFENEWTEKKIKLHPKRYERSLYYFNRAYKKEDLISEIKTERLLLTFRRLLSHYTNGKIDSYPGDSDSFMHLTIPSIKSEKDINGDIFKELYKTIENQLSKNITR